MGLALKPALLGAVAEPPARLLEVVGDERIELGHGGKPLVDEVGAPAGGVASWQPRPGARVAWKPPASAAGFVVWAVSPANLSDPPAFMHGTEGPVTGNGALRRFYPS